MIRALPQKTKQFFHFLIRLSVVVGASYFIYQRLTENNEIELTDFYAFLLEKGVFSLKNGLFLLFLTVFNWFFEILKWKDLVGYVQKISLFRSAKESLSALTTSIFTPNRIGDYAAKLYLYPKGKRKPILLINLLGHMTQMTITVICGLVGMTLFIQTFDPDLPYFKIARIAFIFAAVSFMLFAGIRQNRFKIRGFELFKIREFLYGFPKKLIGRSLLYSAIRYLIFSYQFIVIVRLFGFNLDYWEGMLALSSMYFIASIIPSIQMFDGVIKGSVALYVFSFLRVPDTLIICTALLSWILNMVIPSIIGAYFIMAHRSRKYSPPEIS